jgi:hypothetical protein
MLGRFCRPSVHVRPSSIFQTLKASFLLKNSKLPEAAATIPPKAKIGPAGIHFIA